MNWKYKQPVNILFGAGYIHDLKSIASDLGVSRGLLVCDPFFVQNGMASSIMDECGDALAGVYSDISPNPETTEVDSCAERIRQLEVDYLVALGGGSAMDCAKAAGSVYLTDNSIREYHGTGVPMPQKHLPLIAIPTTAGTGSEVTCVSVLSDHALGKKGPIVSEGFYPAVALIDPELTWSMPPHVTASTGIDVLCHAVEGYWSKGHQPICDALAIYAAKNVFAYLPRAFAEPGDTQAREKMAEASVIAGMAFTLPKTTSSHACSFPLTNLFHIPHGEACALTLDYFARINAEADNCRVKILANELGFSGVEAMADGIYQLKERLGLLLDLKSYHMTGEQFETLVRESHHPNMLNNPVEITDDILRDMFGHMI